MTKRRPERRRHYTLPALCVSAGLAGLSVGITRPILIDIAQTYTVSVGLAGQLMTGAALAGLVGNLALAPAIDRVDRRTAILGALIVMTVATLGCALAPSFVALAAAYALAGLSGITLLALVLASAGDLYEGARRGQALGWILVGNVGVGLVCLPLLSALAGRVGWPAAFYGFAILAALTTVSARLLLPSNLRGGHADRLGYLTTLRRILDNRVAVALLVTVAAYHASIYGFSTYAGAVAVERFGATTARTGLVLTARALGMATAGVMAGRFFRRGDWRLASAATVVGAVLGLLGYATGRRLWWYALTVLLHGAAVGAADIAVVALLLEAEPARRGSITALRSVMEGVGGIVGPASGGAVIAIRDYAGAGWLFTAMALVAALALGVAARWPAGPSATAGQPAEGGPVASGGDI